MDALSQGLPKELLPLDGLPLLGWALRECRAAGIHEAALILRPGKETLEHFAREHSPDLRLTVLTQPAATGVADAILLAEEFGTLGPSVIIFCDQHLLSSVPACVQLRQAYDSHAACGWSSFVRVPTHELPFFPGTGGFRWTRQAGAVFEGLSLAPGELEAESIAGFGRTLLLPGFFAILRKAAAGRSGDSPYREAFAEYLGLYPNRGLLLAGRPADLGTRQGYEYYSRDMGQ